MRRRTPAAILLALTALTGALTPGGPADGAPTSGSRASATSATTAWGSPTTSDDFDGTSLDASRWEVYDGAGHAGNGVRSPAQVGVANGVMTLSGDPSGTTAGLSDRTSHRYGRWEVRARVPAGGDARYHPVLLLWPTEVAWPTGGEIDYAETTATSSGTSAFLHFGADNQQTYGSTDLDLSQWHTYAVDWTPSGVTAYVDGVAFFTDTTASHQPPGPMHQSIQLDWFPSGTTATRPTTLQVDSYRYYAY